MSSEIAIKFENVSFQDKASGKVILSRLDFVIDKNQVTCLLGASGSGKSTILRLISGLDAPTTGTIVLRDLVVSRDEKIMLKTEKRHISLMFQDYALLPFLNVLENVLFALNAKISGRDIEKAQKILEDVGLHSYQTRMPHQLSGGEQQRLALARSLMQNTDIVMLDEPFSNLDSALRRRLREETLFLLRKHNKTVILVTHDSTEAFLSAEKIIYLKNGCQIQVGTPQEIYYSPKNLDIALFSGSMNVFKAMIKNNIAHTAIGDIPTTHHADGAMTLAIRHEGFALSLSNNCAVIKAEIIHKEFAGRYYRLILKCNNTEFIAEMTADEIKNMNIGDIIGLSVKKESLFIFDDK